MLYKRKVNAEKVVLNNTSVLDRDHPLGDFSFCLRLWTDPGGGSVHVCVCVRKVLKCIYVYLYVYVFILNVYVHIYVNVYMHCAPIHMCVFISMCD